MLSPTITVKTAPSPSPSAFDVTNIKHAIFQAALGLSEGGVPIGAALVNSDGVVISVGRNRRVQQNSAIRHGEVSYLPGKRYERVVNAIVIQKDRLLGNNWSEAFVSLST